MVASPYCPAYGDLIWINFAPQSGREITKYRPAIVLSPLAYNRGGLCLVCPISSKKKGRLFEVAVLVDNTPSVVKADQIRSLDWSSRRAKFIKRAPRPLVDEVVAHVTALMKASQ